MGRGAWGRQQQTYTARQLSEDATYAQESLQKLHPAPYWHTDPASLDRAFADVKKHLTKPASEAELLQLLSPVIEQIHCGHTELYPSEAAEQHQARVAKPFPLELGLNGEQAVVRQAYASIPKGATVVAINGHELGDVLPRLRAVIPADGHNQTYKQFRMQHDFAALFARHVQATDSFTIAFREPGQPPLRTMRVAGQEQAAPASKYATARTDEDLRTLVLTVPSFATDQEFPAFLEQTFRTLATQRLTSLVIDLRGNAGGRDEYAALLYSYLATEPFRVYQRITVPTADRDLLNRLSVAGVPLLTAIPGYLTGLQPTKTGLAYVNHPGLHLQPPQPNAFRGPVYVLVNGGTFSAAADFAALVRSHQRGVFIGEEVGGGYYGNASLGTAQLTLPHSKLRLLLPLARFESAVSAQGAVAGHGVVPEHPVRYELADLLASRDKELQVCYELLRKAKQ
ncbi:S41 family peptidase [Hymenobacter volaticus]|uniref:S41 family peptidase n=1 Tax=Hymenobacter volaticus TaxID=2932254 RepID=A0ABY4GHK5_9BACT|nr:S41 family peptidase [Hymenobacter volaticus]UOQ69904.1 S41 family peptidase [Hymenobacter volaticus]